MKLPKPTDDNNAIKVDIYDKKDKIHQIATLGLHLGFSAKLKIWQVPTCKKKPRSGIISCNNSPPTHPPSKFWKS